MLFSQNFGAGNTAYGQQLFCEGKHTGQQLFFQNIYMGQGLFGQKLEAVQGVADGCIYQGK